jgi:alkanesulfonate monooxygenase SsuD/methylene tetrahydromethanopterin reductase-like flavin-dependent oxidoreductase (luciferase family)
VSRLRELGQHARGRPPAIAWNPVAAWTEAMRSELRAHLAYMAVDMPAGDRSELGLDVSRTDELRAIVNSRGPEAAASLIPDAMLDRYAIVGSRPEVIARLAGLLDRMGPELVVFDLAEYSVAFLETLASLAMDAGAAPFQNVEALYGLDSHD